MTAHRRVYDSHHLQSDCQEPGSAPEPYTWRSSKGYLYLFTFSYGVFWFNANFFFTCRVQIPNADVLLFIYISLCIYFCLTDRGRDRAQHRDEGRYSPSYEHTGRPSRHGLYFNLFLFCIFTLLRYDMILHCVSEKNKTPNSCP